MSKHQEAEIDKILEELWMAHIREPGYVGKAKKHKDIAKQAIQRLITEARIEEVRVNSEMHHIMKRADRINWSNKRKVELESTLSITNKGERL